jgi:predicted AAA+ superfamily ATPase
MYYSRSLEDIWGEASRQFPALLLTGPRQVGKTTFLQHLCEKERTYITLDDPVTRSLANEEPGLFMKRYTGPVLIDEIQYAPDLMPYIKMAIDSERTTGRFWLTGSQQFLMMKGISETLAGRVAILNLLGFSGRERHRSNVFTEPFLPNSRIATLRPEYAETVDLKDIFTDIWTGSFPALTTGQVRNRNLYYSSYLQTYLQRDVRDLTQVGDERSFLKFVRACAARSAQLLNLSDIARDTDISIVTAKNWLSILLASFQVHLLQPYYSNINKRLIKTPKLYFLDTGLCSYLTGWASPETLEAGAMSGAIFETYVFSEILKSYWHRGIEPAIFYYRDKDKKEIDFIIEQDLTVHPIEVKKSCLPQKNTIKTFKSLSRQNKKIGDGAVICMIDKPVPITENNTALPITII